MSGLLAIRQFPDPILTRPAHRIESLTAEVDRLIQALIATMHHHPRCVGLAAPQVGQPLRLAVMDATRHPKAPSDAHGLLILINPVIRSSEAGQAGREGCLSIPDFTANVHRPHRLHLEAQDRSGNVYAVWLEGFEAVIAQHEVDHLDGRLFLDRVTNVKTDVFRRKSYRDPEAR